MMKKYQIIPVKVFYLLYFFVNLFISFILLRGWFTPNINVTNDIGIILLSLLGDLGVISLVYFVTMLIAKKDKTRVVFLVIASSIFALLVLFCYCFSNMFSTFFSFSQLISFKNPAQGKLISGYITYFGSMFDDFNLLLPLLLFIFILIISFFVKKDGVHKRRFKRNLISIGLSYLSMFFTFILCVIGVQGSANSVSMNSVYGSTHMGMYNFYIHTISDLFHFEYKLNEDKKMVIEDFLNEHKKENEEAIITDKNLFVIQLEAINDFIIDLEIDGEIIAPNLTKLSKEGYYNNRFYSSVGMGNTSDCEFSTFTGLYPNGNDLSIFDIKGKNYPTIAKEMKELGYYTYSIHGNQGDFYNRNNQHKDIFGFDDHVDKVDILEINKDYKIIKDWIADEDVLNASIKVALTNDTPFYSHIILGTSHSPYTVTEGIKQYRNKNLTSLAENYISNVQYVDKSIASFIESLKENNLYDNSIIILYGDHTSSLLKEDLESINKQEYKKDVEFRVEMQNVPFIMIGEGIPTQLDSRPHSMIDIFSTLSSLYGLTPEYTFGVNMLSNEDSFVYSPRNLDLICDDYVIEIPSKSVHYFNDDLKLSKEEINNLVLEYEKYKYANDLIVKSDYFK